MFSGWHMTRLRVLGGSCRVNPAAAREFGAPTDDASWYEALLTAEPAGKPHKEEAGVKVVTVEHGGRRWLVKWYRLSAARRLWRTPAWREWRGALQMIASGVGAARPLAIARGGRFPDGWTEALIMEHVDGKPLSHYLRDGRNDPAQQRRVFEAVGRQIGRMTKAGWVNRDHKSANIMVTPEGAPVLIDCGDLRRRRGGGRGRRQIERLFALLRETTTRYGTVDPGDFAACIEAARSVDPSMPAINGDA